MVRELGLEQKKFRELSRRFVSGVLVPQLLFFLSLPLGGLTAALVVSGGWNVALQLYELQRRHAWDPFLVGGLTFTIVQGAAALYTRSPTVYAGRGIVEDLLASVLLFGSVAVRHPLLVELLGSVGARQALMARSVERALWRLTLLWALLLLSRSIGLYAALTHVTIGQFLLINMLAGWPLNGVGIVLSFLYVRTQLRLHPTPAGPDPVVGTSPRSDHGAGRLRPFPAFGICGMRAR